MLLIILSIHIQNLIILIVLLNVVMSHSYTFPILCICIYTYKNLKYFKYIINCNIAPNIYIYIYIYIYIFPMFCYDMSCIYMDRIRNILTVFSNVILSDIHIFPTLCHHYVYTPTHSEKYCQL